MGVRRIGNWGGRKGGYHGYSLEEAARKAAGKEKSTQTGKAKPTTNLGSLISKIESGSLFNRNEEDNPPHTKSSTISATSRQPMSESATPVEQDTTTKDSEMTTLQEQQHTIALLSQRVKELEDQLENLTKEKLLNSNNGKSSHKLAHMEMLIEGYKIDIEQLKDYKRNYIYDLNGFDVDGYDIDGYDHMGFDKYGNKKRTI